MDVLTAESDKTNLPQVFLGFWFSNGSFKLNCSFYEYLLWNFAYLLQACVCLTCGDKGFEEALEYCSKCKGCRLLSFYLFSSITAHARCKHFCFYLELWFHTILKWFTLFRINYQNLFCFCNTQVAVKYKDFSILYYSYKTGTIGSDMFYAFNLFFDVLSCETWYLYLFGF